MDRTKGLSAIPWIDAVKAVCMMSVYFIHTQFYYEGEVNVLGHVLEPFYVNAFFFVSGYLLFRKWMNDLCPKCVGGVISALKDLFFRLVMPTVLFSMMIYFPKVLFHQGDFSWRQMAFDTLGGISYWFTSALAVSQIVLLGMIFVLRRKPTWFYMSLCVPLFFLGFYLNNLRTENAPEAFFPWFWKTGIEYTMIMALGGLYWQHEQNWDKRMKPFLPIVLAVYLYLLFGKSSLQMMGLGGMCNLRGFICLLCGVSLVVAFCKKLRPQGFLSYVGRKSIVFYFFSGVYPAAVSIVALKYFPERYKIVSLGITTIAFLLGAATTWIVYRFFPYMTDLRKIKQ